MFDDPPRTRVDALKVRLEVVDGRLTQRRERLVGDDLRMGYDARSTRTGKSNAEENPTLPSLMSTMHLRQWLGAGGASNPN